MPEARTPPNFNRYPMLWLAAAFAAGILAASFTNIDLRLSLAGCAVFAIARLHLSQTSVSHRFVMLDRLRQRPEQHRCQIEQQSVAPDRIRVLYDNGTIRSGDPVEVEGVLLGRPEPSIDGVFLNLRADKITYHGNERKVFR